MKATLKIKDDAVQRVVTEFAEGAAGNYYSDEYRCGGTGGYFFSCENEDVKYHVRETNTFCYSEGVLTVTGKAPPGVEYRLLDV